MSHVTEEDETRVQRPGPSRPNPSMRNLGFSLENSGPARPAHMLKRGRDAFSGYAGSRGMSYTKS